MGAELVSLVLVRWTHVSEPAFRVLVRMALTALDHPGKGRQAAMYHGGRELLAMTLRSEKGTLRTRYRAVQLALAELSKAGAIRHVRAGWAGQNAVYQLTLHGDRAVDSPVDNPVDPERKGGATDHPVGGATSHPMGGATATKRVGLQTTPRNQEEPKEERQQEEVVDVGTTSHAPRATGAELDEPIPPPPKTVRCGHGFVVRYRRDGRLACALCRVAEDRPGTALPPPLPDDHLAQVIPLRTWEAS